MWYEKRSFHFNFPPKMDKTRRDSQFMDSVAVPEGNEEQARLEAKGNRDEYVSLLDRNQSEVLVLLSARLVSSLSSSLNRRNLEVLDLNAKLDQFQRISLNCINFVETWDLPEGPPQREDGGECFAPCLQGNVVEQKIRFKRCPEIRRKFVFKHPMQ